MVDYGQALEDYEKSDTFGGTVGNGQALEHYRKALAIRLKAHGPEHPSVGNTYNNMANVLETQGKLPEAMEMYEKALRIEVKALGTEEHASVGDTKYNMALLSEEQGDRERA